MLASVGGEGSHDVQVPEMPRRGFDGLAVAVTAKRKWEAA